MKENTTDNSRKDPADAGHKNPWIEPSIEIISKDDILSGADKIWAEGGAPFNGPTYNAVS